MAYIIKYDEGGYYAGTRRRVNFWHSDKSRAKVLHYSEATAKYRQSKLPPSKLIQKNCNCRACTMLKMVGIN